MNRTLVLRLFLMATVLTSGSAGATPLPASISGMDLLHSKNITVSAEGARGLVIVFLSAKCPCSDSHSADLKHLQASFPEFRFVGIHSNTDESLESARPYFAKLDLPFPILQDEKLGIAERFKAFKTPHVFLLSPNGDIVFQGGLTESHFANQAKKHYLEDALEAVRNGKNPPVAQARTLGCIIKR